jgi:phospholipid/cholesterol/gamma-HCH transport system ATP-binding protein
MDPDLIMYDEPFSGLDPISCNVVGNLVRNLNDALGVTSIVVSYDAKEALKVIDYVYFIANGKVAAQGPVEEIRHSEDPLVYQFIRGEPDGPVAFHLEGGNYAQELGVK